MITIIGVTGQSGVGKTTLVTALIKELAGRGYRVGAIKHTRHQVDVDQPGKDSARMKESGAEVVALASPGMVAMYASMDEDWDPDQIVARLFPRVDVVLVEGFGDAPMPRIAVLRKGAGETMPDKKGLMAVASDFPVDAAVARYGLGQIKEIADLAETYIMRKADKRDVRLFVNDKKIMIKPFIKDFFLKTVAAMVDSLRGTQGARRIHLTIDSPTGEAEDE